MGEIRENLPFFFTPTIPYYGLLEQKDWRIMQIEKKICIKESLCFCCKTPGYLAKACSPKVQTFEPSATCATVDHIIASAQITSLSPKKKNLLSLCGYIHKTP
uniref:Uncharacterized protein n=1 Tax=Micrurus surinamensis TaxID=129470 RepID=A0A2D4NVU3_MICSU